MPEKRQENLPDMSKQGKPEKGGRKYQENYEENRLQVDANE